MPDGLWPDGQYAQCEIVMSAEDEKTRTGWTTEKNRHKEPACIDFAAMLAVTEAYGPGSCVAVPQDTMKALGGDYDGDAVLALCGKPHLHAMVKTYNECNKPTNLKPPKSVTSAFDAEGIHRMGRSASASVSTKLGLLGDSTTLMRRLLLAPNNVQERAAEIVLSIRSRLHERDAWQRVGDQGASAEQPDPAEVQAFAQELLRNLEDSNGNAAHSQYALQLRRAALGFGPPDGRGASHRSWHGIACRSSS